MIFSSLYLTSIVTNLMMFLIYMNVSSRTAQDPFEIMKEIEQIIESQKLEEDKIWMTNLLNFMTNNRTNAYILIFLISTIPVFNIISTVRTFKATIKKIHQWKE